LISLAHRPVPVDRVKAKTVDRSARSLRPTYICAIVMYESKLFRALA
jgi:hypothetical protein